MPRSPQRDQPQQKGGPTGVGSTTCYDNKNNSKIKFINPFAVQDALNPLALIQSAAPPLQLQARSQEQLQHGSRVFLFACVSQRVCVRVSVCPRPAAPARCRSPLRPLCSPCCAITTPGAPRTQSFIPEGKPRGDFHQLDARLGLSGYYVSRVTHGSTFYYGNTTATERLRNLFLFVTPPTFLRRAQLG